MSGVPRLRPGRAQLPSGRQPPLRPLRRRSTSTPAETGWALGFSPVRARVCNGREDPDRGPICMLARPRPRPLPARRTRTTVPTSDDPRPAAPSSTPLSDDQDHVPHGHRPQGLLRPLPRKRHHMRALLRRCVGDRAGARVGGRLRGACRRRRGYVVSPDRAARAGGRAGMLGRRAPPAPSPFARNPTRIAGATQDSATCVPTLQYLP
jgi:hypothetical protein